MRDTPAALTPAPTDGIARRTGVVAADRIANPDGPVRQHRLAPAHYLQPGPGNDHPRDRRAFQRY